MKIQYCVDYAEMSRLSSDTIVSGLKKKPGQSICTATGNSPMGVYQNLAAKCFNEPEIFEKLRIIKLDEWGGIPTTDPNSCETFIRDIILLPLHISSDRYISFKSDSTNPINECKRIQQELANNGPVDICILGLGTNGHIGFNEPAGVLIPFCHVAKLSENSLQHQMAHSMDRKPRYGLTLGMADILQSKKIILLVTGSEKQNVISHLLSKQITTQLPASFLWVHNDVECFIDSKAL